LVTDLEVSDLILRSYFANQAGFQPGFFVRKPTPGYQHYSHGVNNLIDFE